MATWNAEYAMFINYDKNTGAENTTAKTVEYQPVDQSYPTGKISSTQIAGTGKYIPDSDLNTENAYDVYIEGSKIKRIFGSDLMPPIGGTFS